MTVKIEVNPLTALKAIAAGINVLILLPPILLETGFEKLGRSLYFMLGFLCHQRADRSFYLFGESFLPSKSVVWQNVSFDNIFTFNFAERFTCDPVLGCKFGVCARCTGMYIGLLLGLLVSEILLRYRIPKLIPILMLVPLVLDGTIQTFAYILSPESGFYESTNPRRFVTGLLFGLGIGYFAVSAIKPAIAKR